MGKEGVKETIKEEMTKPEEKRLASPSAYLSVAVPAVYSAMNEADMQCMNGIKDQIKDNVKKPMEMPECAANFDDFKANMDAMWTFIQNNKVECEDEEDEDAMMTCMTALMANQFSAEEMACKGEVMDLNECEMDMEDEMEDDMEDDVDMEADMDKDEEDKEEDAFEMPESCEALNLSDEQKEALKECDLEDKVQCLSPNTEGGMSLKQRAAVPRVVIKSAACVEDLFGCTRRRIRNNLSPKSCMGGEMPEMPEMPDMGGNKQGKGKKMKCYKKKENKEAKIDGLL